jgi:hypothetical protein
MIFRKKGAPPLIQQKSVGLQGMGYLNVFSIIFFLQFQTFPEKLQSGQGRLPSLKGNSTFPLRELQKPPYDIFQSLPAHNPIRCLTPIIHFVRIKAVFAAHVAQPGRRLHQNIDWRHSLFSFHSFYRFLGLFRFHILYKTSPISSSAELELYI